MLAIARAPAGNTPPLRDIAQRTHLSRRYLEQLAAALKTAGLLRARVGRGGGHALTRAPGQMTIRNILEAVLGPLCLVECLTDPRLCLKADHCECRWLYATVNDRINRVFEQLTLADLLDETDPARTGGAPPYELAVCPGLGTTASASTEHDA
jgi:Rrf2 family protein